MQIGKLLTHSRTETTLQTSKVEISTLYFFLLGTGSGILEQVLNKRGTVGLYETSCIELI